MKLTEALKNEPAEPTLKERVESLEQVTAIHRASLLAFAGTLAYNDPEFGEILEAKINGAIHARHSDDAADIGG